MSLLNAFVSHRAGGLWKASPFSATRRIESALFAEMTGSQDETSTTLIRKDDVEVASGAVVVAEEAEETNPAFQPRDTWSKADFLKSEWKIAVQWNNKDTFEETWIRFYDEVSCPSLLFYFFWPFFKKHFLLNRSTHLFAQIVCYPPVRN